MNEILKIIEKILQAKASEDVKEVQVDLKRVWANNFGQGDRDGCYIKYLYQYYANEINEIDSFSSVYNSKTYISEIENIRNHLIKIAIIRIAKEKGLKLATERLSEPTYCINVLDNTEK